MSSKFIKAIFTTMLFSSILLTSFPTEVQANNLEDANNTFSTEETMAKVNAALEAYSINENQNAALDSAKKVLKEKLKNFKVTGVSFCADPNFGFIYDYQNPTFDVCYKNHQGEVLYRTYLAAIHSLGLKFQFSINLLCVFIVNTPFNFCDSNKTLNLGVGIDIALSGGAGPGLLFMYTPFTNMTGGLLIIGLPLGLPGESLSLITGGSLTPSDSDDVDDVEVNPEQSD